MANDAAIPQSALFYLVSSASRTPYVRDILDVISLPHEYVTFFRYLPLWLPAQLRSKEGAHETLHNRTGVVVYADIVEGERGQEFRFFPIRVVTIVHPEFRGPVLYVPMVLQQFVDYGSKTSGRAQTWHEEIAGLPDAPRVGSKTSSFVLPSETSPFTFTISGDESFQDWEGAERGWHSVVEQLAATERFRQATFFRVEAVRDRKGDPVLPKRRLAQSYYDFEFDDAFSLSVAFYHRRSEYIEGRTLRVHANPELFSGDVGRVIRADYQYNSVELQLLARRRFERDHTTIRLEPHEWKPSPRDLEAMVSKLADERFKQRGSRIADYTKIAQDARKQLSEDVESGEFFSAAPEILVRLQTPLRPILVAAALLFFGQLALALPSEAVSATLAHWTGVTATEAEEWAVFVRSFGGLSAFAAIVYVFHKWPLK